MGVFWLIACSRVCDDFGCHIFVSLSPSVQLLSHTGVFLRPFNDPYLAIAKTVTLMCWRQRMIAAQHKWCVKIMRRIHKKHTFGDFHHWNGQAHPYLFFIMECFFITLSGQVRLCVHIPFFFIFYTWSRVSKILPKKTCVLTTDKDVL